MGIEIEAGGLDLVDVAEHPARFACQAGLTLYCAARAPAAGEVVAQVLLKALEVFDFDDGIAIIQYTIVSWKDFVSQCQTLLIVFSLRLGSKLNKIGIIATFSHWVIIISHLL